MFFKNLNFQVNKMSCHWKNLFKYYFYNNS